MVASAEQHSPVFCASSALTLVFVAFAAAFPDFASDLFAAAQEEITHSAGWVYVLAVTDLFVFVVLLAGRLPNATSGRKGSRLEEKMTTGTGA